MNAPDAIAGAVARESEAGLAALSADHLAGDHFKMPLVLPVSAADVAAIKSNNWPAARDGTPKIPVQTKSFASGSELDVKSPVGETRAGMKPLWSGCDSGGAFELDRG